MSRSKEATSRPSKLSQDVVSDSSDSDVDDSTQSSSSSSVEKSTKSGSRKAPVRASSTSPSSSEDESSSEDNTASKKSSKTATVTSKSKEQSNTAKGSSTTVVNSIQPKPYHPPQGFSILSRRKSDASPAAAELLSNTAGKQVWHITAPASFPISSLKEFSMAAIGQETSIAKHRGHDFGMSKVKVQSKEYETVLQSLGNDGTFEPEPFRFTQSYQIYELSHNAGEETETPAVPYTATEVIPGRYARPVRQQPKGLRMRWQPFGTDAKQTSVEDADASDEDDGFRRPQQLPSPAPEESRKKRKKHHHKSSTTEADPDAMDLDESQIGESSQIQATEDSELIESTPKKSKDKKEKKEKKKDKEKKKK